MIRKLTLIRIINIYINNSYDEENSDRKAR